MKKSLILFLMLSMVFSLVSCADIGDIFSFSIEPSDPSQENVTTVPITNAQKPAWAESLTDGYWDGSIQCICFYKFFEDGTVKQYFANDTDVIGESGRVPEDKLYVSSQKLKYEIVDDTLHIFGDNSFDVFLKWVTKSDNYNWDEGIEHHLPAEGHFFYEVGFDRAVNDVGNALYLVKTNDVVAPVSVTPPASTTPAPSNSNTATTPAPDDKAVKKAAFYAKAAAIETYAAQNLDTAVTQMELNSESSIVFQKWDDLLNEVYKYLKTIMSTDEFKALTKDEINWITEKEAAIEAAGAQWKGGTGEPLARNSAGISYTEERCYYLISLIK